MDATSPAVRARSVVARTGDAVVTAVGLPPRPVLRYAPLDDGGVLLKVDLLSPLVVRARAGLAATVEVVDVCPVPVPDRVRGRVWLTGMLRLVDAHEVVGEAATRWAVLRVEPTAVEQAGPRATRREARAVPWADYVAASPDPLAPAEAGLLQHLHRAHAGELRRLAGAPDGVAVAPVALDRDGLTLRVGRPPVREVRLRFPSPVGCPGQAGTHLRQLLQATSDL